METTSATERQIGFVRSLVRDRDWPVAGRTEREAHLVARAEDALESVQTRFLGRKEASELIDWLLSFPRKPKADEAKADDPEPGVYVLEDGTIVLAKPNRNKTNVYTKRWVTTSSDRITEDDEFVKGDWEYDPGLKTQIPFARKMTLDEAKEFLVRYGRCVRCGQHLKVGQSVERGLGPVCVKYFTLD